MAPFRLIGERLTPSHLIETFPELAKGKFFVSGDYKSATDLLKMDVTQSIVRGIVGHMIETGRSSFNCGLTWKRIIEKELGP